MVGSSGEEIVFYSLRSEIRLKDTTLRSLRRAYIHIHATARDANRLMNFNFINAIKNNLDLLLILILFLTPTLLPLIHIHSVIVKVLPRCKVRIEVKELPSRKVESRFTSSLLRIRIRLLLFRQSCLGTDLLLSICLPFLESFVSDLKTSIKLCNKPA